MYEKMTENNKDKISQLLPLGRSTNKLVISLPKLMNLRIMLVIPAIIMLYSLKLR
jgi:hypothetical protein